MYRLAKRYWFSDFGMYRDHHYNRQPEAQVRV
jgi:hypothetical protein